MQVRIVCWVLAILWTAQDAKPTEQAWIPQRASTPAFRFEVRAQENRDKRYLPQAFRVIDRRTGEVVQEESVNSSASREDPRHLIDVVDANFDGMPDILLPNADGGAGPNYTLNFHLYDKRLRRFVYDAELSELSQPEIRRNRTIVSSSRGGCCQHSSATYHFSKGELKLIAEWDQSLTPDGNWVVTTTRKLKAGRWHEHVKMSRPN